VTLVRTVTELDATAAHGMDDVGVLSGRAAQAPHGCTLGCSSILYIPVRASLKEQQEASNKRARTPLDDAWSNLNLAAQGTYRPIALDPSPSNCSPG
jgi:hypothetical protein